MTSATARRDLIELDGELVLRLGYGTMHLTGPGVVGPPPDMAEARLVLGRALELGVRIFDTAWYYGPDVPNQLLAAAVKTVPEKVVIATKLGWDYGGSGRLGSAHAPAQLRAAMTRDLRVLGDSISIVHLRWTSERVVDEPFRRALATMIKMREDGMFRHVGLSNVGRAQLEYALTQTPIASVSNSYSVADQTDDDLVDVTAHRGIAYLPWLPLRRGTPGQERSLRRWSDELGTSTAQVALAWLLQRAPNVVPIPGTSTVRHLEENVAAANVRLPNTAVRELSATLASANVRLGSAPNRGEPD
jgi:aryl-alcohol dehydrogenase-like predicted oxidoreductase